MSRPRRAGAATALALAAALVAGGQAWGALTPGRMAVLDAFADPFSQGHFGALFEADPLLPPGSPAAPLSSSAGLYQASDLAFRADGSLVVVDRDADPSGFGPDANGDAGAGAVFVADAATQALSLLADGSDYPAGLPPPARSAFVDPRGIAVAPDGVTALVADTDADPSGLGPDSAGFAGHGALFAVNASGAVSLVTDGTLSDDGPPPGGAASWLEDPGAACVASDGSVYLLDLFGDPLATGGRGAVYVVDVPTGRLRLVAVHSGFVAPTGIAELEPGRLVVSDQLANLRGDASRGALFAIDLLQPDPRLAVSVLATDARFRGPSGLDVARDGSVFVADPFSDALGLGRIGSVFRALPGGSVGVASAAAQFLAPVSVRIVPPAAPAPVLDAILPAQAEAGTALTVGLTGSGFASPAELRMGDGVGVTAVRVLGADSAEADVVIDPAAAAGARDVVLVNPDLQPARLDASFLVTPRSRPNPISCDPTAGIQGTALRVTVRGERFAPGAALSFGAGVTVSGTTWIDATSLQANLDVALAAAAGPRDVVVTNPDGASGTLVDGFQVLEPAPPQPAAVLPASLAPGATTELVVDGSGFVAGMSLAFGPGVAAGPAVVESPFRARVTVHVRRDAAAGPRDVLATNPDARTGTLSGGLDVLDRPALRLVAVLVDDSAGNLSGAADPGETVGLDVLAWSAGRPLVSPSLRVSVPFGGGATVTRASVVLGASGPGLLRRPAPPLPEIAVDASLTCGQGVSVRVQVLEGPEILLDEEVVLPTGTTSGRVRKPAVAGAEAGARAGAAVALADLDGDGAADLVTGIPRAAPGGLFAAGSVVAVSGATDDPLFTLDGTEANGRLGTSVAAVGDVDGDGGADLLVGAPGAGSGAGAVFLVSGRSGLPIQAHPGDPGSGLGASVALLGDRDLDGAPEALAGAPDAGSGAGLVLVLRLPSLAEQDRMAGAAGDGLGTALAAAGDLDDDGRADAGLGAPGSGAGRVLLWEGDGDLTSLDGIDPGEGFGSVLASGGDADGDGLADLAIGAPLAAPSGLARAGRVEIRSASDGSRRVLLGSELGEAGAALAFAGDLDGDGRADLAVGLPGAAGEDGVVEIRSGGDLRLLGSEPGSPGERGRFGEAIAAGPAASGDAVGDLVVGAPAEGVPGIPLAGRAALLKSLPQCAAVVPCLPDALEPSSVAAPAAAGFGRWDALTICRDDVDAYRIDLAPGLRASVVVRFRHSEGDLDASLHDAGSGATLDQSLSLDDDEELGPFGPGGTFDVRVAGFEGATNAYSLEVLDPDTCIPLAEIALLRVRKSGASSLLSWQPSGDPCHAPPPGPSYRVWLAASPAPAGAPGPFPAGSAFADVTASDGDGDLSDAAHESAAAGPAFWLVTDVSRSGQDGPSGWPAGP